MRFLTLMTAGLVLFACSAEPPAEDDDTEPDEDGTEQIDPNANADGDCMTDAEELALGTDPNAIDSDLDGVADCDEIACVSDPLDVAEVCYACGWQHNDPGDIVSTGSAAGDVMANFSLVDQCGEEVAMHDFAGAYHILYMTAGW